MTPWKVRVIAGSAGGIGRQASVTLQVDTLSDTVEQVRCAVEAVPQLVCACQVGADELRATMEGCTSEGCNGDKLCSFCCSAESAINLLMASIAKAQGGTETEVVLIVSELPIARGAQ